MSLFFSTVSIGPYILFFSEYQLQCNNVSLIPSNEDISLIVIHFSGYIIGKLYVFEALFLLVHCSSANRYSNCFMVLLNQRIYFEASPVSGTMSTLGCSKGQNRNSVQLSTIQFRTSRTLAQSNTISQAGPSNHNDMKKRQDSMETKRKFASTSLVWDETEYRREITFPMMYKSSIKKWSSANNVSLVYMRDWIHTTFFLRWQRVQDLGKLSNKNKVYFCIYTETQHIP